MLLRKLALASSLAVAAAPAAAFAETTTAHAVVVDSHVKSTTPSPTDGRSYAEREQQDKQAGEFAGGDLVVIGVSGGALIVLLFLLLILV